MSGIIIFGDEVGIPLALKAMKGIPPNCVVIDPKRQAAQDWLMAQKKGFKVMLHPGATKRNEFTKRVSEMNPTLGLVVSYSRILWPELIAQFHKGAVNLHGGKLPQYRGANVLQWAIINGESETAVTLHYIDEGIDTGPIITELPVEIKPTDTALSLRSHLILESKDLLSEWLPRLIQGRVRAEPQDQGSTAVWPRRKPEDGCIDWEWSNMRIRNLTRALVPPWPGAFFYDSAGRKIIIKRALSLVEVEKLRKSRLSGSDERINLFAYQNI